MQVSTHMKVSIFQLPFRIIYLVLGLLCLISNTWAVDDQALNIENLKYPSSDILASAQPDQSDFSNVAKAGVQVVVNLRPHAEQTINEQLTVESLGMSYINLPVPGAEGVTFENAQKLDAILNDLAGKKVLVHCSSGNRVGALAALNAYQKNGNDVEAAIETGKQWGLTRLETIVRTRLMKTTSKQ